MEERAVNGGERGKREGELSIWAVVVLSATFTTSRMGGLMGAADEFFLS